jgi:hypothetical protein
MSLIEHVASVVVHGITMWPYSCTTAMIHISRLFDYGIYDDLIKIRMY